MAPRRIGLLVLAVGAATLAASCGRTVDSLGDNGEADAAVGGEGRPAADATAGIVYPNAFHDLLGKSSNEIEGKITAAFAQLFHGDPDVAVFVPVGTSQAYILDTWFMNVPADGLGYGMMIAVQLDKPDEFDRLWTWTKMFMQIPDGPLAGTVRVSCSSTLTSCSTAPDAYATSYVVTALLFASRRWGSGTGIYNYALEGQRMLAAMPLLFDTTTGLAVNGGAPPASLHASPSFQVPAFAEVWSRTSSVDLWRSTPGGARSFWKLCAHPVTGLVPGSADFMGKPVTNFETFSLQAYPFFLDLTLDHVWFGIDPWQVTEANRVIEFFTQQGIADYGDRFTIDGTPQDSDHSTGLVSMNGALALAATTPNRDLFVQAVWDAAIPTGPFRYADGMLYLESLLVLSGKFKMY